METIQFTWIDFYSKFATKLMSFKNDRQTLIRKQQKVYSDINIKFPKMESDNVLKDIDPFTIFGMFNNGRDRLPYADFRFEEKEKCDSAGRSRL